MLQGVDYVIAQGLFLKAIGLIYLFAFASLKTQVLGLFGSKGIVPLAGFLNDIKQRHAEKSLYFKLPTFFWISASDRALILACWAGVGLSILVLLGVFPAVCLILLWLLYQSFYSVGSPFMQYQWDALLLEVGFLAFLFAIQSPPPLLLVYLLWFLLFRFMFSSGLTKVLHGSKEWRDLTAMDYHYETQPLPTPVAWYAHHQPKLLSKMSTLGVHFFELAVPLLIFGPPPCRQVVFILFAFFQLMIILTGNYTFFNWLTIFLGIPLLPDNTLSFFRGAAGFTPLIGENLLVSIVLTILAAFLLFLNALELLTLYFKVGNVYRLAVPFRRLGLLNPYGLFVRLTTWRDEVIIEGSRDGENWEEYEFHWKPGDLKTPPKFVAPHQPRLDWQMWFAALSTYERNRWLGNFLFRLLENSEDVVKLLKINPFKDDPPKFVRAVIYKYRFSTPEERQKTGQWWSREYLGQYSPRFSLKQT